MGYLLGIDVGTSGTKTLICNQQGHVLSTAQVAHTVQTPQLGFSEQDPNQWWAAVGKACKKVRKQAGIQASDITGIGLSGQMHGSVFVGADHAVLRPAILWNDQRTQKQCDAIAQAVGGQKKLIQQVGNPALTGFTAPKILWVREHEPKVYDKTQKILLPKDYIRLLMTGQWATDVGDASGTLLLNVKKRAWNKTVLNKLQIDADYLPKVFESHEITGELTPKAAKHMGLQAGTPVVAGSGDQPAGAVGSGIVKSGIASATLGTSGVVFAHSKTPTYDTQGRVHTMCSAVAGEWCVFGCMLSAAGSFQWYRDQLFSKQRFDQLVDAATHVPVGSEGLYFLPYLTGERCPHPDPNARGGFIGLTARHTQAHMTRALLEGVTYGMTDIVQIMRDQMQLPMRRVRLAGGGAKSAFWRQLQADMYGLTCATTNSDEGPAYGAALLAGVGNGVWRHVPQACQAAIEEAVCIKPDRKAKTVYQKGHQTYQALYPALKSVWA